MIIKQSRLQLGLRFEFPSSEVERVHMRPAAAPRWSRSGRNRRMKTITGNACKRESSRARGKSVASFSNQPARGLKPLRGQPRLFSLNHNNETDLMSAVKTKLHASACPY